MWVVVGVVSRVTILPYRRKAHYPPHHCRPLVGCSPTASSAFLANLHTPPLVPTPLVPPPSASKQAPTHPRLQRLPRNLHYLFTLRKPSLSGALYLLLTWMFPMAGLLYFVAPKVCSLLQQIRIGERSCAVFRGFSWALQVRCSDWAARWNFARWHPASLLLLSIRLPAAPAVQYTLYHAFG